ncbi:MAG: ABC transporter ATP-binding protein [Eubacteriales bacterium]|nr:ABC transporter ATP-binding protein [Eubacteriales bacterium]
MALLEVKHLKTYFDTLKGQYKAVDDVNFDLEYGEALGLVGESGCGKTTCALSIARLLPKEGKIYGGKILLEGTDMVQLSDDQIREKRWKDVSIVFQGAMNALNPVMKVGDQIAEAIMLHEKIKKEDALRRTERLFELVEMPADRIRNYPHEFSGGMKQRAMIAMALACNPKIIIGDEPTTALDVMVQAQILNLLEKLRRELNMGLILITHDLSILGETCDKIAVMYAGKIVEIGMVEDIFERTAHPYTKRLISCFPNISKDKVIPAGIEGIPQNMLEPQPGCSFYPRCHLATDLCKTEVPTSIEVGKKHFSACHRASEVLNGR